MAKQPTAQLVFPSREAVTTGQLQNAMMVCSTAITGLIHWRGESEDSKYTPQNSEARIALENTLIKACDRLDKILIDDRRWSIEYQMNLEDEFKKSHELNKSFLESQCKVSEEISSPHFQHKPTLAKSQDGQLWFAILGDKKDLANSIVGIGRTPDEALQEFDKNFQGQKNSPEVIALLKKRVKDQKNYGQEQVEQAGVGDANQNGCVGDTSGEDSRNSEPPERVNPWTNAALGPKSPQYAKDITAGWSDTRRGSQAPRKAGLRSIASFLSRLFRLDKNRAGR